MLNEQEPIKRIAVLIDAENARRETMAPILEKVAAYGKIDIKRAYGDWSTEHLKNWKKISNGLAIMPRQQFVYTAGKNAIDILMVLDAMDLLHSPNRPDIFVLVSSDSDFTGLASRLREDGIMVLGVGETKTPQSFISACDEFIYIKDIEVKEEIKIEKDAEKETDDSINKTQTSKNTEIEEENNQKNKEALAKAISAFTKAWSEYKDEDNWARVDNCGSYVKRVLPDFSPKSYGAGTMTDFIKNINYFVTVKRSVTNKNGNETATIYYKPKGQ